MKSIFSNKKIMDFFKLKKLTDKRLRYILIGFGILLIPVISILLINVSVSEEEIDSNISYVNNLPADAVSVLGVTGLDLSNYEKINITAEQLEVSSVFNPGMNKEQLVQPGLDGFWHVMVPKIEFEPDWVSITLDRPRPVALLRVFPRKDLGDLMWRGYRAVFQVSENGNQWKTVAALGIMPWPPENEWLNFLVLVPDAYTYYRLYIEDLDFVSIGRMELYQYKGSVPQDTATPTTIVSPTATEPAIELPAALKTVLGIPDTENVTGLIKITIDPTTIQVSSFLQEGMGGSSLIQDGTTGFWHLKTPRAEIPAWVTFSILDSSPVQVLRIFPRLGSANQLWDGPTGFFEGSPDGKAWETIAALDINRSSVSDEWISFTLDLTVTYKYYRLSVYDMKFLSLGRIELYALPD